MKASKWILLYALLATLAGCVGSSSDKSASTSALVQSDKPELSAICADGSCGTCTTTCSSSCVQNLNSPVLTGSYSSGNVNFSWPAIGGATYYKVWKGTETQARTIINSNYNGLNYSDSGIYSNTQYTAQACNACGCGGESASYWTHYTPTSGNTCTGQLTNPLNFVGTVSGNSVGLTWSAPSCGTANYYKVYRDGVCLCTGTNGCGSSLSYNDNNLANGTYQYAVQACNSNTGTCSGLSPYISKTVTNGGTTNPIPPSPEPSVPPSVPSFTGSAGNSSVTINWTQQSGVTYQLYRYLTGIVATASPFTDSGLTNGSLYYYALRACNSAGCSAWSSYQSYTPQAGVVNPPPPTPPSAPSYLTSPTSTSSSITVNWPAVSGATYYILSRGSTVLSNPATSPYTDSGLTSSTSYTYQVQACNANGCSSATSANFSTQSSDPPPPSGLVPPTNLQLQVGQTVQRNSIPLQWNAVSGATKYKLFRDGVEIQNALTGTTFTDTGLTQGTTYRYTVQACNTTTCSTSSAVFPVTTSTINTPVVTATVPSLANGGNNRILISWTAVDGATMYKLYRQGSPSNTLLQTGPGLFYTDLDRAPGTSYTYLVEACSGSGTSQTCSAQGSATARTLVNTQAFTVSGKVNGSNFAGLQLSLVDRDGADPTDNIFSGALPENLTISATGAFRFATKLLVGKDYKVEISRQPNIGSCAITGAFDGLITNANITNIVVNCTLPKVSLLNCAANAGTLSGNTLTIPYGSGFASGRYNAGTAITSTSPTGYTLNLVEGRVTKGVAGVLTFNVTTAIPAPPTATLITFPGFASGSVKVGNLQFTNTNLGTNCAIKVTRNP